MFFLVSHAHHPSTAAFLPSLFAVVFLAMGSLSGLYWWWRATRFRWFRSSSCSEIFCKHCRFGRLSLPR